MEPNALPAAVLSVMDTQSQRAPKGSGSATDPAAMKKVAQEFEAIFVGMMLKSMRATVGKDEVTGGGRSEETFRSLLDQQYAEAAARNGGIGLARMIEKELTHAGAVPPAGSEGSGNAD